MAGREAGNTADDTSGAGVTPAPGHPTDEAPPPVPHQAGAPDDKPAPGEPADEAEQADAPHPHTCTCPVCPRGTRAAHREAQAAFRARRDALAAGEGLPAAVSYSAGASRQWISDELTQAAREVGARARAEAEGWYVLLWRRTVYVVWGSVAALFLGQVATAFTAGWTAARTAGLLAALLGGGLLTGAAHLHGRRGGVLAPVIGEDNRLSTSRAVAAFWVLLTAYAVLVLAGRLAFASGDGERDTLLAGLDLARGAGLVTVLAVTCAVAVVVRRVVAVRVQGQRLQKAQAPRPRAADLLTDDNGRAHFADTQYVLVSAVAVVYALVRLARRPDQLPDLPWGLGAARPRLRRDLPGKQVRRGVPAGHPRRGARPRGRRPGRADPHRRRHRDPRRRIPAAERPHSGPARADGRPHRGRPRPRPAGAGARRLHQPLRHHADRPGPGRGRAR